MLWLMRGSVEIGQARSGLDSRAPRGMPISTLDRGRSPSTEPTWRTSDASSVGSSVGGILLAGVKDSSLIGAWRFGSGLFDGGGVQV